MNIWATCFKQRFEIFIYFKQQTNIEFVTFKFVEIYDA